MRKGKNLWVDSAKIGLRSNCFSGGRKRGASQLTCVNSLNKKLRLKASGVSDFTPPPLEGDGEDSLALASWVKNARKKGSRLTRAAKGKARERQCAGALPVGHHVGDVAVGAADTMAEEAGRPMPPSSP